MTKEYNPYAKHMKSSKSKYVATYPNGDVVKASNEKEFRKKQAEYRQDHPESQNRDDPGFKKEGKKIEKPQFDPNTGERLN